ncbi:MAG: TlpA family protein disulfide reductase [Saprospiraceae bacterium]|jgi:peroxiredoxin|nr:TlpA family protein disulfide reductase [Saprospiraceae bacterium]
MYLIFSLILALSSFSATSNPFPSVNIKTIDGKTVNTKDYTGKGKITVVSFWATWCTPCKRELDAINELYPEWKQKYDIELLAITIDDARGLTKVPATIKSKGWEFTVLADTKQELQQALNFQTIPQTFLLNEKGEIVYSHNGYSPGDELKLESKIKSLKK